MPIKTRSHSPDLYANDRFPPSLPLDKLRLVPEGVDNFTAHVGCTHVSKTAFTHEREKWACDLEIPAEELRVLLTDSITMIVRKKANEVLKETDYRPSQVRVAMVQWAPSGYTCRIWKQPTHRVKVSISAMDWVSILLVPALVIMALAPASGAHVYDFQGKRVTGTQDILILVIMAQAYQALYIFGRSTMWGKKREAICGECGESTWM